MDKIINNKLNLKEQDMTEVVKRVKLLMINSKNEILMGYSHNDYQFIGGHIEKDEKFIDAINREIEEETGIKTNYKDLKPFACIYSYYKDYPSKNVNRKIEIYYYKIIIDKQPDLSKTNYTEAEKQGNFKLVYIPLQILSKKLNEHKKVSGDKHGIIGEMLNILEIFEKTEKE